MSNLFQHTFNHLGVGDPAPPAASPPPPPPPAPIPDGRRKRTAMTYQQLSQLHEAFTRKNYLSDAERAQLSVETGLSYQTILVWFQNTRKKLKKRGIMSTYRWRYNIMFSGITYVSSNVLIYQIFEDSIFTCYKIKFRI